MVPWGGGQGQLGKRELLVGYRSGELLRREERGAEKGEDERNPPDSVSTHHHVQTLQRPQRGGATASLPFKRNTHFFWFTLTQIHSVSRNLEVLVKHCIETQHRWKDRRVGRSDY